MMRARFMMTSKTWKINKTDDKVDNKADNKADSKADDISKICNAYSKFLWSKLQFNNHKSS